MSTAGTTEKQQRSIKIAIVSDLHAVEPSAIGARDATPSWLADGTKRNIKWAKSSLSIEEIDCRTVVEDGLLLCPGDLSHRRTQVQQDTLGNH